MVLCETTQHCNSYMLFFLMIKKTYIAFQFANTFFSFEIFSHLFSPLVKAQVENTYLWKHSMNFIWC